MNNTVNSLSDEIIKVIEYFGTKLNLTLDVKSEQLLEFSEQLAYKIVRWELLSSAVELTIWTTIIVIAIIVTLKLNKKFNAFNKMKCALLGAKYVEDYDDIKNKSEAAVDGVGFCMIYAFIAVMCFALALPTVIGNIVDISKCLLFPEKIIIEFIAKYLSI